MDKQTRQFGIGSVEIVKFDTEDLESLRWRLDNDFLYEDGNEIPRIIYDLARFQAFNFGNLSWALFGKGLRKNPILNIMGKKIEDVRYIKEVKGDCYSMLPLLESEPVEKKGCATKHSFVITTIPMYEADGITPRDKREVNIDLKPFLDAGFINVTRMLNYDQYVLVLSSYTFEFLAAISIPFIASTFVAIPNTQEIKDLFEVDKYIEMGYTKAKIDKRKLNSASYTDKCDIAIDALTRFLAFHTVKGDSAFIELVYGMLAASIAEFLRIRGIIDSEETFLYYHVNV